MCNHESILVVAIGGVTCSFKSTMAKKVKGIIANEYDGVRVELVHQDEYYLTPDQVPIIPELNHYDYECPQSLRMDDLTSDVGALIDRYSNTTSIDGDHQHPKTVIIVEGIMLFCHEPLRRLFHQRYFTYGSYQECKTARSSRTDYVPPDVDGYFDGYIWPAAVRYENEARNLSKEIDVQFLPMNAYEKNLMAITTGIRKWLDRDWILLTPHELDVQSITKFLTEPTDGALSIFCGITRDTFDGKSVVRLEYEAYEAMAYSKMRRLCSVLREKWKEIDRVAIHHRLGVVPVTETSVVIAVSSPHRKEAQSACSFAVDELKRRIPIWKKEIYADESGSWKENSECCTHDQRKNAN